MKKIINVITLIVMVSVNVLTPFTYADSFGDVFVETQEIDEVVAENGDFSDEEEIDEISDEDQDDEIDIDEDENESDETDEDSESDEDDTSEEQTEEEGEQTEEEGEQTEEEGEQTEEDENLIDENNENEEGDTQDSQPDEQSSIDVQNDEEVDDENDFSDEDYSETPEESPIDAVKESIESFSGNILTGDIEFLTGEILTGEVVELTGKDLELSLARETLNEDLIQKSEYYNGVSVNVEAQPGTFPQGTELRINPITLKKELNEIKEQIIDSQENVSEESELVAFDISFIYILSGGEEIEVQPKNGDGVKVVFNYENNENLSEADNNDEQKVKVFHIDDKDENGEKVVQGEEIVKDVTNRVESEEDGIAVANAESFSIYAVVTTTGNPGTISITHDLNGGYWLDGNDLADPRTIEYTCTNNSCTSTTRYRTPRKDGYMFMGWYDQSLSTRWTGNDATSGMTVYAKWQEFGDLNVYILKDDEHKYQYTLMDRNMGATGVYNNSSNINPESRGRYYQWGNNYGFDSKTETPGALSNTTGKQINTNGFSWETPYYSSIFYTSKDKGEWTTALNKDLRGDGTIKTNESKQGPCPAGYHIPSKDDWQGLLNNWKAVNDRENKNFYFDFLIPSAGIRDRGYSKAAEVVDIERYRYASSSRNGTNFGQKAVIVLTQTTIDSVPVVSNGTNGNTAHERSSNGLSVRCFKNITGGAINVSNIDLNGGTGGILSIASGVVVSLQTPKRGIDTFGGWYTNEDFSGDAIENVNDIIPEGTTGLYAKWDCGSGYVEDGGECVEGFKITFNASKNGGTTTAEDIVVTGSAATKTLNLADYTAEKEGYYFVGWNTDVGADTGLQGQQTFTQNTKLYAIFLNLYTYRFEDINGNFLGTGYYQSGVEMNMTKLIPLSYYTGGKTADLSGYEDLFTLGLTPEEKPIYGMKWTPELPEQGIATEDLVITGEKLEAFDVRFLNYDDSDFIRHRVVSGTILQDPETYPREPGLQFEGWYTDNTYSTEFEFPVSITTDVVIYSKFIDVYCSFITSAVGTTGLKITGFSGTQTEECLTNFVIPSEIGGKTVLEIGDNAFKGDKSGAQIITGEIILPNTITTIGTYAFYKNDISGELRLPNSLITIDKNAFNYNAIGGYLVIPDNVTLIGESAFKNRNQITGLKLGNSVTTIGNQAFYDNKIEGILQIPNSVTSIGSNAFYNNKIEGELIIPNSVTTIGESAFQSNQLTGLILGNSVQTIRKNAFYNNKIEGELIIPNSVTTIWESAFRNNQITGLILGNSVQTIGTNAFNGNKIEGELIIPDSVVSIGGGAFYNNNISGTLRIPGGVTTVTDAFKCNLIEEVIFGEGITTISDNAFATEGCTDKKTIKKVIFPSTLQSIGNSAFSNQIIEGEFIFPESLTTLGTAVFRGNNISGTLVVPGRLNGGRLNGAFRCNLIENVIIEEGITVVGEQAFYDVNKDGACPKGKHTIKTVQFPSSLTGIEFNAFRNNQLTGLILGENVETIGYNAFDNQYNESGYTLNSIELNDKLQQIQYRAFATNDIKSVYIPDSVENLSGEAFDQGNDKLGHKYITGYVTTKKSTLDYTGAYIKPLYQLYTYTFVNDNGDILGTGYYPEILESNTTKVIPLNYYNGIGNVEDFVDVDSLISHNPGEVVVWSTSLSEHDIVTENLVVTGSTAALHTVTFKNPFTGDIVEHVANNDTVEEPEEFVVQGYTFTGWFSGDVKVDFPLTVISDLTLTGRYDINKYTLSLYSDKENPQLLSGIVYDYNTTINTQPIEDPTKTNYDFAGWKNVTGDADVVFPLTITGNLDIYANWEDPTKEWIGWDGCYQYRTYTGEVEDTVQYYAEITAYSGAESCPRENLTMPNVITRNGRNYTIKKLGYNLFSSIALSGVVTLPNYLEIIGDGAFSNYGNDSTITSVIISEGLTSIGNGAFQYNSGLKGINLPSTLKTIGNGAFYSGGLESLIIPDSVISVGNSAFSNNTKLKTVKIGDGLTILDSAVFYSCTDLETVELGNGIETIRSAFADDISLKNIIWGNNVKNIYGGAFYNTAIEELEIPDSATYIYGGAFSNNTKLKTVKLGTGLETLNSGVFWNCTGIEYVDLGNLESIGAENFSGTQITGLVIPDTVTYISDGAFSNNTKLKTVKIGTGLKDLYDGVFGNCTGIETLDLGRVQSIGVSNFANTQITGLVIPDTVKYISNGAFSNNAKLESVIFTGESQIQSIGAGAFSYSALTGVSLPNSLTTLGKGVFCADDGTNTGTVIGFIGDDPSTSAEELETQDDTACFVIKNSTYNISTGSNDETQGSVSVYGEPRYGKRIEFRANVHDTSLYKFVKWELNGKDVMTGDNQFWTGDLVIENLTGDLIVTGHFAAYSGCSWSGGEIAHGTSVTGYLTPTVPYGETCVSEIRTCNDGILSGTYEYASCTPEGASSCDLPWGGTVPDGTSVTGYKTSSEKCPDECESVIAICNNGNWNVENFTGIYTEPSCVTQPVSTEGYDLDECPEHGICSSITGYTVSENVCIKGDEKFKLDGCDAHYHTGSDNKSCEIDKFDIVWNYRDENGTRTGETIKIEYGKNPTEPTLPEISQTAQTGYTFSGWTPEVSSPVTTGAEYTAQYNETTREYLITFLDGDGEIIQTGMVAYGVKPSYTGETPTKTATAQYSYSFNNTWEPEIIPVTTGAEYTAQFNSTKNKYTVTINANTNSGSVSTGSVTENWGSLITESENELTIGDTTVIATAKTGDAQYTHEFSRWNNTCGDKVETGCSIEAEFTSTIREYTITFHSNEGSVVTGQTKQYGSHVDEPADPTRQGYGFSGWYSNISLTQKYNFTETVTGDLDLYAKWTPITYTIGYELNGGVLPAGQENPTTYTIESNDITLKNPTKIGYIFSGWTGTELSTESMEVTIASGSMGDRVYYANWQPDNVNVTVYYFTQKLNPSTNELIDEFDTHDIKIVQMQSDLEFNIYDEFYEHIEGFEYVRATVTEQDTSEHTETTTTVLPNGSRVINLYYTRGQYNFAIIPVDNVTTQGSSENSGYYYGATITLSGSSSNDCFMWSGWTNLPEGTINNSQTSFTMPANAISLSGVVTEKTYNISFNGNGADEGEMETLNGIACTQSIYLPINKFKKVGHTFTGWTTTIDGSKEYNDRVRIQTLTTGNNTTVNLIAVWDINKYDIVWKNYNGETLDSQILEYGVIPEYGGEYPLRDPDIQFSYSFSGWTPEIQRVEGPQVYTAVYSTTLNEYTITWDVDGTITTETYEYGAIPYFSGSKGKVPDKQYIYTFSGWNPQISPVSGNITYTATYTATLREYTVTWINSNGDVLEIDENIPYGTTPTYDGPTPTKEGDTEHHYTFAGWAPAVGPILGDTTYEAIFDSTKKEYTIIWQNENGGILETDEDVPYGTTPSYDGPTPTKASDAQYSYEFAGWTPETGAVVGHQIYTATYTAIPRKYTVTWKNRDGTVIRTDTGVEYGTTLEYQGPTPTSGGNAQYSYEFTGWEPAIGEIHGDTTYTAVYTHKTNKYTITWKNRDGTVIKTVTGVEYGATPIYGDVSPTKTGDAQYSYEFIGWEPGISTVTGDTSYTAKFKENLNRYKVIFINDDSGTLKEATEYDYGTSRNDIEKPTDPTKASDVQYSYEFAGWEPSISVLTGDITFKATYTSTVNKYTVTWKNRNGSIIKTNTGVEYGTEPEYDGPTPTKESTSEYSYRFTGWEPAIGEIHGDTTYTAQFEPILESYTITWKDRDGRVLKVDENVPYGFTPIYSGDNPSRSGNIQYDYIFDGWTPSLAPVHGDATYTAKYRSELKKYKVIWKNWDDEVLETDENVLYGSTPKYDGEEPTRPGSPQYSYVFDRWTPNIHAVDGDVVYKAVFEELINKYTVTWENWDESVIKTDTGVEYGTVLEYDGPTPTKEGDAQYSYEFSGWDNEIKAIHEDTTYRATYIQSVNEYLITFLDGDGKIIQTGMVAYGATPNYTGSTPTKAKTQEYTYTFNNTWSPEIHSVEGEETYTAQFNSTKNKYTITINANTNSGSINTGLITTEYGTPITESGNELKIGDTTIIATAKPSDAQYTHEFSGWNNTCGPTLNDVCTIEAEFRSIVNKYLITFLDGDGKAIQTGMVAYGATPNYTGSTPTKTKTQEYTYTFNGNWSPAIHSVTTGETYTAQFNSTKNKYTITINANTNSGSINTGLITAEYGTSITESGNELKIGDTTIIATAKPSDAQYTHEFSGWNNTCGLTLNDGCIIEAEFRSIIHKYTVIWNNEDGMQLEKDENVPYGTMPQYNGTTPVKPGDGSGAYVFDGWNPNPTIVVGNVEYTAKYKEKTSPQDDNTGNRRSGGGRRHYTSDDKQHGSAEDIDNPSDSEKEVFDAYKRAYKYGITTIDNEQKANPNGYVTRGHLAKMVVNFTVNVLGREMPVDTPTKCKRNDDDSEWKSSEIKFYAEKSCALGVMGLYTKKFMPNKIVDRAEFGTVVSRLLWGDKYDELDTHHHLYFTKHLKALQENGFMKDIDNPLGRKEIRKRVWLVLKRIEQEKNK